MLARRMILAAIGDNLVSGGLARQHRLLIVDNILHFTTKIQPNCLCKKSVKLSQKMQLDLLSKTNSGCYIVRLKGSATSCIIHISIDKQAIDMHRQKSDRQLRS